MDRREACPTRTRPSLLNMAFGGTLAGPELILGRAQHLLVWLGGLGDPLNAICQPELPRDTASSQTIVQHANQARVTSPQPANTRHLLAP